MLARSSLSFSFSRISTCRKSNKVRDYATAINASAKLIKSGDTRSPRDIHAQVISVPAQRNERRARSRERAALIIYYCTRLCNVRAPFEPRAAITRGQVVSLDGY